MVAKNDDPLVPLSVARTMAKDLAKELLSELREGGALATGVGTTGADDEMERALHAERVRRAAAERDGAARVATQRSLAVRIGRSYGIVVVVEPTKDLSGYRITRPLSEEMAPAARSAIVDPLKLARANDLRLAAAGRLRRVGGAAYTVAEIEAEIAEKTRMPFAQARAAAYRLCFGRKLGEAVAVGDIVVIGEGNALPDRWWELPADESIPLTPSGYAAREVTQ